MSGCIHQAPAMYCGACAPERLERALDLIEKAQWEGGGYPGDDTGQTAVCPWCGEYPIHAVYCPAAALMGWERKEP